jgi:membrane dipeptidase
MQSFIDLHQDLAGASAYLDLSKQTSFSQLEVANAKVVLGTGFTLAEENMIDVIERDFSYYEAQCAANPAWSIVKSASDVERIIATENARGILFHIEGFPLQTLDLSLLEKWYGRGWRSAGLVWNDDNILGGGTHTETGLTKEGEAFIRWCEEKSILIDLAHANPRMFADCIVVAQKPVFISHSALHSLFPTRRTNTDEQLRAIAESGGILGIFFAGSSMSRGVFSARDVVAHIKKAVDIMGEDAVALGTDFGGITSATPVDMESVDQVRVLWNVLRTAGFTERAMDRIAHGNARRFLMENLCDPQ